MVGYQKNKLIINLLRLSALIWCPAAVYSYYPLSNLFNFHAVSLSILIFVLVCSYIEASAARYSGGNEKQQHQRYHKYGMIISVFISIVGVIFMLKRRFDQNKGILFIDRSPTTHSSFGLLWICLMFISSSSGWITHSDEKELSCIGLSILKFLGMNNNIKKGKLVMKRYHRNFSFISLTTVFVASALGLYKSKRVILSYSLGFIYFLMCLIF